MLAVAVLLAGPGASQRMAVRDSVFVGACRYRYLGSFKRLL